MCLPPQTHVSQADRHATLWFTAQPLDNAVTGKPCAEPHLQKGPAKTFPSTTAQEVRSQLLLRFCTATVQGVLTSSIMVWFGSLETLSRKKLQCISNWASKLTSSPWPSLESLHRKRTRRKALQDHLESHSPCTLCLSVPALWEALQINCLQNNPFQKQFHPNCNQQSEH